MFYYDKNGSPISETRQKPELTAPDGVNTTFFGMDLPEDDDPPMGAGGEDPNFIGTSAAAPNAAAVAAVVLHVTGQNIAPAGLESILRQAAMDIETPGEDDFSGAGTVDALRAVRSLETTFAPLIGDLDVHLDGGDFMKIEPTPLQDLQALTSITLGDGGFGGLCVTAPTAIFTDGFESGNAFKVAN